MTDYVSTERHGRVAVITVDNPPVNALSFHVREPLLAAFEAARDDNEVTAIVLATAGRTFIAGADISEFGKPIAPPTLRDLIATLEQIRKPTVAAIHGTALGGGLELALGATFRVAAETAKLGFPEVKLGLLPGGGGTVRLPYLIGARAALAMIVSGTPISAREAAETGLVDRLSSGDVVDDAVAFALGRVEEGAARVPVRDRRPETGAGELAAFDADAATLLRKSRGLEAPLACAQAVRNALTLPFEEALEAERVLFERLVTSDELKAQRHLFFAEREAAKVAGVSKDLFHRLISRAGVIGAGTMGGGIAMTLANAGIPVVLLELKEEALERGLAGVRRTYDGQVARRALTPDERSRRLALISGSTSFADLAECDLIIEAVFEDMGVKRQVFSALDRIAKPGALLASNTSYLDINDIAASTSRPGDVLGTHFFSPAHVMRLLEIVRGRETSPDVLATALDLAKRIGKVPVVVGVCHGFVGNRMLAARGEELEPMLLEGATPQQIDEAFAAFGWPMGPFQMADLAGLDIGWRNRKAQGKTAVIADALCEAGRLGQKTGKGWYRYEDGGHVPSEDPEVEELIRAKAAAAGIEQRTIGTDEITERTLYPMINEGTKILEEGIAARSSDIDVVWVNGYGFPVGKGGPMFYAERLGLAKILERLEHWHRETGKAVYDPSLILLSLAAFGGSFADAGRR